MRSIDVLIVGAGAAGLAAAIFARLNGLDVLIIEKSDKVGGTAATSAGTLWIPQNSQARESGDSDSVVAAATYLDGLIKADTPRTRRQREAFLSSAAEAIDCLQS